MMAKETNEKFLNDPHTFDERNASQKLNIAGIDGSFVTQKDSRTFDSSTNVNEANPQNKSRLKAIS